MSESSTCSWVTAPTALRIAAADWGSLSVASVVGDLADLGVGQLTAQQGEERDVVHIGNPFGVSRTQPVDDRAQEGWQRHVLKSLSMGGRRPG